MAMNSTDLSQFFTVESITGFYREELSLAVNSGSRFNLRLLLSIIKCLSAAADVTFGAPAFLLSTFVFGTSIASHAQKSSTSWKCNG